MFYLHFLRYDDGTFWYRGGTEKKCVKTDLDSRDT